MQQPPPGHELPLDPPSTPTGASLDALFARATSGLNPAQAEAVGTLDGPLLVVAGPGSGKTRVLTHRLAALVGTGVLPEELLAVTFTNKAAEEMRERLAGMLAGTVEPDRLARMWVCTFHSACVRILRSHAELIGRTRRFGIADADDARRIITRLMAAADQADQARDVARQISLAKNRMLAPSRLEGHQWHPELAHWWGRYQDELAAQDLLDFDDLLLGALAVLAQHPELRAVYQQRFTHVLVDEFQDTNAVQYQILRLLGEHGNVCVVGDADQAVYGFRGATPTVMQAFERDWPGTKVVVLGENYRSTPAILEVAQAVIDQNPAHHRPRLTTANPPGPPAVLYEADTDLDEARWVAGELARSSFAAGEHAVIYRTNAQSRTLEQALRDAGVPYRIVGGVSFFDSAEIRDAMAWLRLAVNPRDQGALRRAATAPKRGIGETTLGQLLTLAHTHQLAPLDVLDHAAAELPTRARKPLARFAAAVLDLQDALAGGPVAAVDWVLAQDGFVEAATTREGRENPEVRRENLQELAAAARAFMGGASVSYPASQLAELDGVAATEAFLTNAALLSSDEETTGAAVQLMTAHAAKGREFDVVFVVGVEDGFFPHLATSSVGELEEEVRLLFVAVSRARHRLSLSWARTRLRYTKREERELTPFLDGALALLTRAGGRGRSDRGSRAGGWSNGRAPARVQVPRGALGARDPLAPRLTAPTSAAGPRVTAAELGVGVRVVHDLYGEGTVTELGAGGDTASVRFASGLRVMMLAMAPMRRLDAPGQPG